MSTGVQTQVKAAPKPSFTPVQTGFLQRKCGCGGSPGLAGECAECRNKKLTVQRRATGHTESAAVPPIVQDVLRSPGQPLDATTRAFMESRFGARYPLDQTDGLGLAELAQLNAANLEILAARQVLGCWVAIAEQVRPH